MQVAYGRSLLHDIMHIQVQQSVLISVVQTVHHHGLDRWLCESAAVIGCCCITKVCAVKIGPCCHGSHRIQRREYIRDSICAYMQGSSPLLFGLYMLTGMRHRVHNTPFTCGIALHLGVYVCMCCYQHCCVYTVLLSAVECCCC